MIVAVQFVYCFLKEAVQTLLFGYSKENQESETSEDSADQGERSLQLKEAQGE